MKNFEVINLNPRIVDYQHKPNGGLCFTIHRHVEYPGTWLFTCRSLNRERIDLLTDDFKRAEKNALVLVNKIICSRLKYYASLLEDLEDSNE